MQRIIYVFIIFIVILGCDRLGTKVDSVNVESDKTEKSESDKEVQEGSISGSLDDWESIAYDKELLILKKSLFALTGQYYDPSLINPAKMAAYAVDGLQNLVPEAVAIFDSDIDKGPKSFVLKVKDSSKEFSLDGVKSLVDLYRFCVQVYGYVNERADESIEDSEMEYAMINGFLSSLDPHSNLLPPRVFKDMMTVHGGFAGLGFVVGVREERLLVLSPIEGGPAARAGLKAGDEIVEIGDESTINMPLQDAVDKMRGDVGTKVRLGIKRSSEWKGVKYFDFVREQIRVHSLDSKNLKEEGIGYLKLKSFEPNSASDIKKKLEEMDKALGGIKGLILDLRDNTGGLLEQAIAISELFLSYGQTIVITEGVDGEKKEESISKKNFVQGQGYPMVILINAGSASASEIVSGALQHYGRAVVVGERSFGKGSVQVLMRNSDDSALKFTVAQYLTPGDISIQGTGIQPDIELMAIYLDKDGNSAIFPSDKVAREESLSLSLRNEKTKKRDVVARFHYLFDDLEKLREKEKVTGLSWADLKATSSYYEDEEIRFALSFLKKYRELGEIKELGSDLKAFFESYASGHMKKLEDALSKHGVDWRIREEGESCGLFSWSFDLERGEKIRANEDKKNGKKGVKKGLIEKGELIGGIKSSGEVLSGFDAGYVYYLKLKVKNGCESEALQRFAVSLSSNSYLFDSREFVFGRIEAGQEVEKRVKINVNKSVDTRDDRVDLKFWQDGKEVKSDEYFVTSTHGIKKSAVDYLYWIEDVEKGNGDGKVQVGEEVDLAVLFSIRDEDMFEGGEVVARLKNESGERLFLKKGSEVLRLDSGHRLEIARFRFSLGEAKSQEGGILGSLFGAKPEKSEVLEALKFKLSLYSSEYGTLLSNTMKIDFEDKRGKAIKWKGLKKSHCLKEGSSLYHQPGVCLGTQCQRLDKSYRIDGGLWESSADSEYVRVHWKREGLKGISWVKRDQLFHESGCDKGLNVFYPMDMVSDYYQVPQVQFKEGEHQSKVGDFEVSFEVGYDSHVKLRDYQVYVWTTDGTKTKIRKVDYGVLSEEGASLKVKVPISEGDNTIMVIVRDSLGFEGIGSYHVYGR